MFCCLGKPAAEAAPVGAGEPHQQQGAPLAQAAHASAPDAAASQPVEAAAPENVVLKQQEDASSKKPAVRPLANSHLSHPPTTHHHSVASAQSQETSYDLSAPSTAATPAFGSGTGDIEGLAPSVPSLSPFTLHQELGQLSYLGQGACGVVYLGTSSSIGSTVAVKFMICTTPQQLWQRAKEALLSKLVNHPHLVRTLSMDITQVTETKTTDSGMHDEVALCVCVLLLFNSCTVVPHACRTLQVVLLSCGA